MTLELDHSGRSDYIACNHKYDLRWRRHVVSTRGATALRFGLGWHGCMEGYYNDIADRGWTMDGLAMKKGVDMGLEAFDRDAEKFTYIDDYRTKEAMVESFIMYIDKFSSDYNLLKIIETEKTFKILIEPNEFEQNRFPGVEPFYYKGRLDLEVELNGMVWIVEFKTTGQPISIQIMRLHRSPQIIGYIYAGTRVFERKPEGSLVSLHQMVSRKVKSGGYGKYTRAFQRQPMIIQPKDLAHFRTCLVQDAWRIQQCDRMGIWTLNHYNCYMYGGCTYIGLCEQLRPRGTEILEDNYKVDPEPWDVLNEGYEKDNIVEVVHDGSDYEHLQRQLYSII